MSGSSLREKRLVRNEQLTSEERERQIQETLRATESMTDEDIDVSDIPEWTAEDFARAIPNPFYKPVKQQVTLRLDRYILEWFRQNHDKYQPAINDALMDHIRRERATKSRG